MLLVLSVLILYPYVLYPLLLELIALCGRRRSAETGAGAQSVSVLIPAHNEERVIEAKLRNTLKCLEQVAIPAEVLVVSDGSTDQTCEIVRGFGERVRLIALEERRGKLEAIRAGTGAARHEVILLTDADVFLAGDAISLLLARYRDPHVGGVSSSAGMPPGNSHRLGAEAVNAVLRRRVRRLQSDLGSCVGADGAAWSIRRELLAFPEHPVISDDLVLPLGVVHRGRRFVYESRARSYELGCPPSAEQFGRRVRTITGGLQAAMVCGWVFRPRHWATGFHFVSWKLAQYLVGFWTLLAMLVSTLRFGQSPFYAGVAAAGGLVLVLGGTACLLRLGGHTAPYFLELLRQVLSAHVAPAVAAWRLIRGDVPALWTMAARPLPGLIAEVWRPDKPPA